MTLAIMQPYFFPYLGYYSLIKNSDKWVVFDSPQFIRHGWIERNRILKPNGGSFYIQVPLVKHSRDTSICDIRIRNDEFWKEKIIAQLTHYKKVANYYTETIEVVRAGLDIETDSITELNVNVLKVTCQYLRIPFNFVIFSTARLDIGDVSEPDEWALEISKALGATTYINPPGGKAFFNQQKYLEAGIQLKFLQQQLQPYRQFGLAFEPGLSIIDVMMFNAPQAIKESLDDYHFI